MTRSSAALRQATTTGPGPRLEVGLRHGGWFAVFLLLAPIVGPRGYGLFILAYGGIAIVEALLVAAITAALTRQAARDERHVVTAFATLLIGAGGLTLGLRGLASVLGAMMDDAEFADILQTLSLVPLLGALAVIPSLKLRRDGRDTAQFVARAVGAASGAAVGVGFACAGTGAWSLAAQVIVQHFVVGAALWLLAGERIGLGWSRRCLAELLDAVDARALDAALPTVSRYAPCLVVGAMLGPIAAGLYMLASRLAEAVFDVARAPWTAASPDMAARAERACSFLLPAMLGAALLAVAAPPLLDIGWWGAIRPAQILLLGALPAALDLDRTGIAWHDAKTGWRLAETAAGLATVALAAPAGLTATAAAAVTQALAVALVRLWSGRRRLGDDRRAIAFAVARPCAAAAASALLLYLSVDFAARALAPLPASCLLAAAGWLCYRMVRGFGPRPRRGALSLTGPVAGTGPA